MARQSVPAAEVVIDESLVRGLLEDQHPDLAGLPLRQQGSGWDNALFRLGDALTVRLPRRAVAAPLIEREHRWLPLLAPRLPLPVPVAERVGVPGRGYPWTWGVSRWVPGTTAARTWPFSGTLNAGRLAEFLTALHTPAPEEAPISTIRGVPLATRTERLLTHLRDLEDLVDRAGVVQAWEFATAAAPWSGPRVWVHGDLHPGNIIVQGDAVVGVIDFGDMTSGDPATDLACAWMLFAPDSRDAFRRALVEAGHPVDDPMWARARGWALALNVAWLTMSVDDQETTTQALATIDGVLADT